MDLVQQLINFAEAGNQQKIVLANGQILQGWIMEITDDALLISTGFNEKAGQDIWLQFKDLDNAELWFWDNHHQHWQMFTQ